MSIINIKKCQARTLVAPLSLVDQELISYNVKYEQKTVIDGHSDAAFAGAAVGSIIAGTAIGLVAVSSLFQISILGIQVPRPF